MVIETTGMDNLCIAGGMALNCVRNSRLRDRGPFKNIWIQPAAGTWVLHRIRCYEWIWWNEAWSAGTSRKYPALYRARIQAHPPWDYYAIVLSFLGFLAATLAGYEILAEDLIPPLSTFCVCTVSFITGNCFSMTWQL